MDETTLQTWIQERLKDPTGFAHSMDRKQIQMIVTIALLTGKDVTEVQECWLDASKAVHKAWSNL